MDIDSKPDKPTLRMKHIILYNYMRKLETFHNWKSLISPRILAIAGFEYVGYEDICYCTDCNLNLYDWKKDDIPFDEHKRKSPFCLFVKLMANCDYIPDDTEVVEHWLKSSVVQNYKSLKLYPDEFINTILHKRFNETFSNFITLFDLHEYCKQNEHIKAKKIVCDHHLKLFNCSNQINCIFCKNYKK